MKKKETEEKEKLPPDEQMRLDLYDWIQSLMVALVICIALFIFVVRVIDVSGSSMFPTLHNGDKMIVSNLFYGLPINGYCSIGMDAVGALADAVGGVTVPRMTYENGEILYGKNETVTGEDAISYVRTRGNDYDAATYRLEKQKRFLQNFVSKLKSSVEKDPTSIVTLYNSIKDYVVTDIDMTEIVYLADHMNGYTLNTDIYSMKGITTPAEDAKTGHEEFVYDEQSLYDMIIEIYYREVDPSTGKVISADGSDAVKASEASQNSEDSQEATESTEESTEAAAESSTTADQ